MGRLVFSSLLAAVDPAIGPRLLVSIPGTWAHVKASEVEWGDLCSPLLGGWSDGRTLASGGDHLALSWQVGSQERRRTLALEAKIAWDPGASWAWGPGRVESPTCFALGACDWSRYPLAMLRAGAGVCERTVAGTGRGCF